MDAKQNGARARAIDAIQAAFPELSDEQLLEVAMFTTTYRRLANLLKMVDMLNETKVVVK